MLLHLFTVLLLHVAPTAPPGASPFAAEVEKVMDRTADPCNDFYQYACGGWLDSPAATIPSDDVKASRVYQGGEMGAANDQVLKEILEVDRPPILTDYYTSCMATQDTDARHRRHATPSLTPYIAAINHRTSTPEDLVATIGLLHQVGVKAMWYLSVGDDLEAPKTNMLQVVQGGLGLPGAEYYSGASADMKAAYIAHVAKVLELVSEGGEDDPGANAGGAAEEEGSGSSKKTVRRKHAKGAPTTATRTTRTPYAEAAKAVFVFESQLAGITVPNASTGDFLKAASSYHPSSTAALPERYPGLPLVHYLQAIGFDLSLNVNIVHPTFFGNVSSLLFKPSASGDAPSAPSLFPVVRWYLLWQLGHHLSPFLPTAFGDLTFQFYGQYLQGQKQRRPSWAICLAHINTIGLGQLLGKHFVEKKFGTESQDAAKDMLEAIRHAFIANLPSVAWLDAPTRAYAKLKADAMVTQMGRPAIWDDYADLPPLGTANLFSNAVIVLRRTFNRLVHAAGGAADPSRWELVTGTPQLVPQLAPIQVSGVSADAVLNPQTVSAFNPESPNYLLVPAAELQMPNWNRSYPPAMLYGGAGAIVGHEFTHGFDNVGRHFDKDGGLKDWWSQDATAGFANESQCIARQYSGFEPLPGQHIDGNFTLQEDIADNGGLKLAHSVYSAMVGNEGRAKSIVNNITNDQLFFLQYGQIWCFNMTTAYKAYWLKNNQHATPKFRVLGNLQNKKAFAEAYSCPAGSLYNPKGKCELW